MFSKRIKKIQPGKLEFSGSGRYAVMYTDNESVMENNLAVLSEFDLFLERYRIDYCKGLIMQGKVSVIPGYAGWDVAKDITAVTGITVFGEKSFDIKRIKEDISNGCLYAVCTAGIKTEPVVVPEIIPPAKKNKIPVLGPAVSGAAPVSFSRAWAKKSGEVCK